MLVLTFLVVGCKRHRESAASTPTSVETPQPVVTTAAASTIAPATSADARTELKTKLDGLFHEDADVHADHVASQKERPLFWVSSELTTLGGEVYGRKDLPVFLAYTTDRTAFDIELPPLGCPKAFVKTVRLDDTHAARELLSKCKPRGPALLATNTVAPDVTVGRAALALLLDSLASDELRETKIHHAYIRTLLGPAQPK